jgi:predicted DNA-binding protein
MALTGLSRVSTLTDMEVRFKPETESRLNELAAKTGRAPDDLVEDAMAGYLAELADLRQMLDSRYDDIKSGRVKPIDGEEGFARLRHKSEERRSSHS